MNLALLPRPIAAVVGGLLFAFVLGCSHQPPAKPKAAPFGISKRVPWTTSQVTGSPEPPPPFRAEIAFPKIHFKNPVVITAAPGSNRFFVGEQQGKVYSFRKDRDVEQADLFFDAKQHLKAEIDKGGPVKGLEALYGLTFHPQFEKNRYVYVCYVVSGSWGVQLPDGTRVSRFRVTESDPPRIEPGSEQIVITWLQGGHNGGCLAFGPDGNLYISTGDGGFANPPDGRNAGQDMSVLLSSVLRIDVDHPDGDRPYSIPADNPFVGLAGSRAEKWCYGLRNPWKMSFDRKTGDLWIADVGWELWELVFRAERGGNYGWSVVEGRQQVHPERKVGPTPILPATIEIPHTDGVSVTGGHVYRGQKFPELTGQYLYGDWETRRIWAAAWDGETKSVASIRDLVTPTVRLVAFAEDLDGELFLLDYDAGTVHELVRNDQAKRNENFPTRLSDTGLFANTAEHRPAPGVIRFSVNAEQWADHAVAERLVAIPGTGTVKMLEKKADVAGSMFQNSLQYPADSVLVKTFSLDLIRDNPESRRRIETQLLHFDGQFWRGYSYRWNEEQTDAVLVDAVGGETTFDVADAEVIGNKRQQTWHFPSRVECFRCHNQWAEYTLGFNIRQLNKEHRFSRLVDNQLRTFEQIGLVDLQQSPRTRPVKDGEKRDTSPDGYAKSLPKLTDPYDVDADLHARARSYLHANCAHCHRTGGGGSAYIELREELPLEGLKALDVRPTQGTFDIADARILAAADPARSTLFYRIAKTGSGRMPHIGSEIVDDRGVRLMHDWIRQLPVRTDEMALIQKLKALDEPTAKAAEEQGAEKRLRQLTQNLANERREKERLATAPDSDPPTKPAEVTDADRDAAAKRDAKEAQERAESRVKQRAELLSQLLSTTSRAILLSRAIQRGEIPDGTRDEVVTTAAARSEPHLRDLFEQFLPPEKRIKRLGSVIQPEKLLAMSGDAARGRDFFFRYACKNCHKIGEQGGALGPELTHIAKKLNRAQILDSLLEPSKIIDQKYILYVVETKDGRIFTGLQTGRTESELILRDATDKEHRIATADIEEIAPQRRSIMPDLLLRDMTAEQVADLLALLESLK